MRDRQIQELYFQHQIDYEGIILVETHVTYNGEFLCVIHDDDIEKFAKEFYELLSKFSI